MVSLGPYHEKTSNMYILDQRLPRGSAYSKQVECPNSLSYIISNEKRFSKFRYILRLSKLNNLYNDIQSNSTLFVPTDNFLQNIPESVFINMDLLTARQIIKASTLKNRITNDILKDNPSCYFITENSTNKLLVTNFNNQTKLNNQINLLDEEIFANNGIIHVIDDLILPLF
mgnify:CR=1 FL=1